MTYSELQFIKAEAQLRKTDKAGALVSYKKAIDAHVDFANSYANLAGNAASPAVTAAQKTALLAKQAAQKTGYIWQGATIWAKHE